MNDLQECKDVLLEAFPNSFINKNNEFIAHLKSNQYFRLEDCETPLDIDCKVLEWLSRSACKGQPFSKEWRNKRYQDFMLKGINDYLGTNFTAEDMELIYTYLGNAVNHQKTIRFIQSNYDLNLLEVAE